jgi:hypothetical protein
MIRAPRPAAETTGRDLPPKAIGGLFDDRFLKYHESARLRLGATMHKEGSNYVNKTHHHHAPGVPGERSRRGGDTAPAAAAALSGLAPSGAGQSGDAELRRLFDQYRVASAAYEAAETAASAAREKYEAGKPDVPDDMSIHTRHEAPECRALWIKHGVDVTYDAWNRAHEASFAVIEKIRRTPAEGLFGVGVKLAALPSEDDEIAIEDYEEAVASALTNIDRLIGSSFTADCADTPIGHAATVEPDPDAALLALVDEYLAAYAEHDRLNDVIEEALEQKRWDELTQAERDAARHALDVANERIYRGLLPRIEETPARTLAGAIGKAKVVITELPDDSQHSLSLSFARDLLALDGRAQS